MTTTAQSWSATFDVVDVNADFVRMLFGSPEPSRHSVQIDYEQEVDDLPPAPMRRPGLTGRRYRISRRSYGRSVRAWRRAGRPKRKTQTRIYMPSVDVRDRGQNVYEMRPINGC